MKEKGAGDEGRNVLTSGATQCTYCDRQHFAAAREVISLCFTNRAGGAGGKQKAKLIHAIGKNYDCACPKGSHSNSN